MVIIQFNLYKNECFYHNSGPRGSPDMIWSAFDVKFHDKNEGMPPRACGVPTQIKKNSTNAPRNGAPARPSARAVGAGVAASQEEKKGGMSIELYKT